MAYLFASAIISIALLTSHQHRVTAQCDLVETESGRCKIFKFIKISGQKVNKGEEARITLPGLQEEVRWYCEDFEERFGWSGDANQIRVDYQSNGAVRLSAYKCCDLSGPKKAGMKCAVVEATKTCPKFNEDSPDCVTEILKTTSDVYKKTVTKGIYGKLRVSVLKKAGALGFSGGFSEEITQAKVISHQCRKFLVIPAGYSYCIFTNNTSVPDRNAPTGFKWRCSFPEYAKKSTRFWNGRCSSLELCKKGVCENFRTSEGRCTDTPTTSNSDAFNKLYICIGLIIVSLILLQ